MERFDLAEEALRAALLPMHRAATARTRMWSMAARSWRLEMSSRFGEAEQLRVLLLCCAAELSYLEVEQSRCRVEQLLSDALLATQRPAQTAADSSTAARRWVHASC